MSIFSDLRQIFSSPSSTNSSSSSQTENRSPQMAAPRMALEDIWEKLSKLHEKQSSCFAGNSYLRYKIEEIQGKICSLEGGLRFEKSQQAIPLYKGAYQKSDENPFEKIDQKVSEFKLTQKKLDLNLLKMSYQLFTLEKIKSHRNFIKKKSAPDVEIKEKSVSLQEEYPIFLQQEDHVSTEEEKTFSMKEVYDLKIGYFLATADANINQSFIIQKALKKEIHDLQDKICALQASFFLNKNVASLPKMLESQIKTKILAEFAFGAARWKEYIGEVEDEPPLPLHILELLDSPCPFTENKKVKDTHILTLIPETVNKKNLTLSHLHELVQIPIKGYPTKFTCRPWSPKDKPDFGKWEDIPQSCSEWVLMTREEIDIYEKEREVSMTEERLKKIVLETKIPYQKVGLLQAATSIFMHFLWKNERLAESRYIECDVSQLSESYSDKNHHYLGKFNEKNGLDVLTESGRCYGLHPSVTF